LIKWGDDDADDGYFLIWCWRYGTNQSNPDPAEYLGFRGKDNIPRAFSSLFFPFLKALWYCFLSLRLTFLFLTISYDMFCLFPFALLGLLSDSLD
jgi:hypothetical protein